MTPQILFLALVTMVNAHILVSQFTANTCSLLDSWENVGNVTGSVKYLLGGHESSILLSENCAGHLETAFMNCMDSSEFLCSEFSISIVNTIHSAKGSTSVTLAKRSTSDQISSASPGCTCPTTDTPLLASSSLTASESSGITASLVTSALVPASSATGAVPSKSTLEATSSMPPPKTLTTLQSSAIGAVPSESTLEATSSMTPTETLTTPQSSTVTKSPSTTITADISSSESGTSSTARGCIIKIADLEKGLCYCLDNQTISSADGHCQIVH